VSRNRTTTALEVDDLVDDWREGAACLGCRAEFVDVPADLARGLVESWCWRCPVVGRCRELGDRLAPHPWRSVYGARVYAAGEPADGWPEEAAP
jgi:hypothetical protein